MLLNNIGEIDIYHNQDLIFSNDGNNYLITHWLNTNHYFELNGESAYYACYNDKDNLVNFQDRIVDAIVRRMADGKGLIHKGFKGKYDIQLRSMSSAIRVLLDRRSDSNTSDCISRLANLHYKFYVETMTGFWFCHDSSEYFQDFPKSHLKIRRFCSKDKYSTFTLNTHVDSLTTLLLLEKYKIRTDFDKKHYVQMGIKSLNFYLSLCLKKKTFVANSVEFIDSFFINKYASAKGPSNLLRIWNTLMFKCILPTPQFKNGFMARDLSVCNSHYDYHCTNIVDLLRLSYVYDNMINQMHDLKEQLNKNQLLQAVENGISFVESNPSMKNYVINDDLRFIWYSEMHYLYSFYSQDYLDIVTGLKGRKDLNLCFTPFVML